MQDSDGRDERRAAHDSAAAAAGSVPCSNIYHWALCANDSVKRFFLASVKKAFFLALVFIFFSVYLRTLITVCDYYLCFKFFFFLKGK